MNIKLVRAPAPRDHVTGPEFVAFLEAHISSPESGNIRTCLQMTATHFVEKTAVGLSVIPTEHYDSTEQAEARAIQVAKALGVDILYLPPEV